MLEAVGELTNLAELSLRLIASRGDQIHQLRVAVGLGRRPCQAQVVGESQEALLGPVVEVALEASPLRIARLDDPCARGAKLLELSSDLGLELLVLDRDARPVENLLKQVRLVEQARVVHQSGNGRVAPQERGNRLPGGGTELDRTAGSIDVTAGLGPPVRDFEPWITERLPQSISNRSRLWHLPELDDQAGDRSPCLALPQQPPADRQCKRRDGNGLVAPQAPIERAVAQNPAGKRMLEVPSDERDVDRRRNQNEKQEPGTGAGRTGGPPQKKSTERSEPADSDAQAIAVERVEEAGITADQREVSRAFETSARLRIEDGCRQQAEQQQRAPVRDGHHRKLEA